MTKTPETDAMASPHIGFYSCATVPANFARKLEIQRNEARSKYCDMAEAEMMWDSLLKKAENKIKELENKIIDNN